MKRGIKIAVTSAALVFATATPAFATVVNVGGGTWDYGVNLTTVWSNYYHGTKCHRSSVQSGSYYTSSGNKPAGQWSYASQQATASGNEAYWSTTC